MCLLLLLRAALFKRDKCCRVTEQVSSSVRMCVTIGGGKFMLSEKCRGLITKVTLITHHTVKVTICNDTMWIFANYCLLF